MARHKSYRCSFCSVNWPMIQAYRTCPTCDVQTWGNSDEPTLTDAQARDRVGLASQADAPLPGPSPAHANRVDRYLDMGFSQVDAELMATCKDGKGFYLYHHDIRRQLDAGLTHSLAVQIYA